MMVQNIMKIRPLLWLALAIPGAVLGQPDSPVPVLLDKETLSGLNLEPYSAPWATPGRELFRKVVYEGQHFDVTVMAGNTARTTFDSYPVDELVYVMNGQATLTPEGGEPQTFHTGEFFVVPKGFRGEWHSQGNKYFQELIVIMKDRSEAAFDPGGVPLAIDKAKLSGLGIPQITWSMNPDREVYREVLYDGTELDIAIVAGATATTRFTEGMSEEFVYVANGTATLTPDGGEPQTFYSGDFFVVPEGFTGTWTSTGNHLYRELIALPGNK